jgi:hypothetical protein
MEELDEKPEMLRILEAGRRQPSAGIGLGAPPRRINDENTPPGAMRATSAKRMYDDDGADSQRKRSASGTSSIMACVDSGSGSGPGSGATSTLGPRRVSSRARGRVVSATSLRRDDDGDIAMSEHADLVSAAASARARIAAARNLARQIRADGVALRSLPGTHSRTPSGSILERGRPIPARDRDELSRAIVLGGDELESALADALADAERVKMFAAEAELVHPSRSQAPAQAAAEEAAAAAEAYEATITTMEGQLQRAKEREELLADQLRRRDLELEEIYNAFNAELDGMYNDMTLPRADGVVAALRQDVAAAKAARNTADLENRRLKLQIEEEKLKREQWSQLLHARGLL